MFPVLYLLIKIMNHLWLVVQSVFYMVMIWIPAHALISTFCPITWFAIAMFPSNLWISCIAKWFRVIWISNGTKIMTSESQTVSHLIIWSMRQVSIPKLTSSSRNSCMSISTYKCLRGIQILKKWRVAISSKCRKDSSCTKTELESKSETFRSDG